ncbi:hypothetical protein BJX76DRAFT_354511 [Aspergillus varians]
MPADQNPGGTATTERPKRSKTGCTTCRAKKVKCDEQRPDCSRCRRLRLNCRWESDRPSLRERRQGHGTIRLRTGWQPSPITPRRSLATPESGQSGPTSLQSTVETNDESLFAPAETHGSDIFAFAGLLDDNPSTLPSAPIPMAPSWEELCGSWPWPLVDHYRAAVPSPLAAWTSITPPPVPCSVPLTSLEHRALDHYSNAFSISFTRKHPRWSTLSVLRSVGFGEPVVMNFLLAVSLNDLWCRGMQNERELHLAAQRYYQAGTDLLAEMKNELSASTVTIAANKHVYIMASFWFVYMYKTATPDVDVDFIRRLGIAVADHICKYRLDELCSSSSSLPLLETQTRDQAAQPSSDSPASLLAPTTCSAGDGSLIALMMICLYYQDLKHGFYHCGGKLAAQLNSNKLGMGRIYDLARNALALYWGTNYPISELVDDSETYAMLKFLCELNILLEDLNCEFLHTRHDEEAAARYTRELERLRLGYASVLDMAAGSCELVPGSGTLTRTPQIYANLSMGYFHAVKIYLFRCTFEDPAAATPSDISTSLNIVLHVARRVLGASQDSAADGYRNGRALFHRLEWPLFIAGTETKDVIYQDWILQKMYMTSTQRVLKQVLEEQARTGKRVGVEFMRQLLPSKRGE